MNAAKSSHNRKIEHLLHRVLHGVELVICGLCLLVLMGFLGLEIYRMFTEANYFSSVHSFLNDILTIVVGLEFVRMLMDLTPASTLEVLIMATARYIILNHEDPITLLIGVVCVAGLFAIRRFLVPKNEMQEELVETE